MPSCAMQYLSMLLGAFSIFRIFKLIRRYFAFSLVLGVMVAVLGVPKTVAIAKSLINLAVGHAEKAVLSAAYDQAP